MRYHSSHGTLLPPQILEEPSTAIAKSSFLLQANEIK